MSRLATHTTKAALIALAVLAALAVVLAARYGAHHAVAMHFHGHHLRRLADGMHFHGRHIGLTMYHHGHHIARVVLTAVKVCMHFHGGPDC